MEQRETESPVSRPDSSAPGKKQPVIANRRAAVISQTGYKSPMKTKFLLLSLLLVAVAGVSLALAQPKRPPASKEFMREKLELSQRVLEGLATEDFDLIIAKGSKLVALSKEADWRVYENPDYDQQSVNFRRQVNSMVKAAKEKNLDAATLAYVRLTMSCIDCHKFVRGKLVAAAGSGPSLRPD